LVRGQDGPQVPLAEDQHPVGDLGPGGEHEPFRVGIRARAPGRDFTASTPMLAKSAPKDAVNCPTRSRTRNRKSAVLSPRSINRLRICCVVHGPSGFAVTPRICTYREPISITKKQYRRCRVTAQSTWKKSAASIVAACARRKFPCRIGAPLGRRRDLQRLEDPADRRRANPVADLEQLTLDPLVSPAVVLGGEPLDERG